MQAVKAGERLTGGGPKITVMALENLANDLARQTVLNLPELIQILDTFPGRLGRDKTQQAKQQRGLDWVPGSSETKIHKFIRPKTSQT